MKSFIVLTVLLFGFLTLKAQTPIVRTATFSVKGNCGECKSRIENAADIKGVKYSVWDEKTQVITVTYRPDKVTPEAIQNAIAAAGHDIDQVAASDKAYHKLPACCRYRDKKCEAQKE